MDKLLNIAGLWIFDFRSTVGLWFLRRALAWLPVGFSIREGVDRGMQEQTAYDHYAGYTRILGARPWPFLKWRELASTLVCHSRQSRPHEVQDTSKIYVLRETA